MLFHCCDARAGSSGSGAYELHKKKGKSTRYVIGVFSGNRDHISHNRPRMTCDGRSPRYRVNFFTREYTYQVNFNAVLRFNENDVYHICSWMRKLGGENCKKFLKERLRRRKRQSRKRRERNRETRCRDMF